MARFKLFLIGTSLPIDVESASRARFIEGHMAEPDADGVYPGVLNDLITEAEVIVKLIISNAQILFEQFPPLYSTNTSKSSSASWGFWLIDSDVGGVRKLLWARFCTTELGR